MIQLHDIETAVAARITGDDVKSGSLDLSGSRHTVTAAEIEEGFDKPTFFIDIFQNSVALENQYMELVNVGVELRYFPATETREALVEMADELRDTLTATPLTVGDRFLSVSEVTFDTDNGALLAYFELEFMRETAAMQAQREYKKMQNMQIGVKLSYGTSSGSD